jgi:CYTH domain-containing protein
MGVLCERFQSLGYRVFRVPEAATLLLPGMNFASMTDEQRYNFQSVLLKLMISMEDAFVSLAKATKEKCIVLCDRGTMDCRSYMPEEDWIKLTKEVGSSTLTLRDSRYDCVVHFVTAADGAEAFYTTEGHAARTETASYARELDERIKNNWIGHPHVRVIDNSTDFNGKIKRVISTICQVVGLASDIGIKKHKFLVRPKTAEQLQSIYGGFSTASAPYHRRSIDMGSSELNGLVSQSDPPNFRYQIFDVQHDYITRNSASTMNDSSPPMAEGATPELRLRSRGHNGEYTYSYTLRYPDLHGQRIELKRLVTWREYGDLLMQRDSNTVSIIKKRFSFIYRDQYFELDQYISPSRGLYLLEFYSDVDIDHTKLPNFLEIVQDVTAEKEYGMHQVSIKNEKQYNYH